MNSFDRNGKVVLRPDVPFVDQAEEKVENVAWPLKIRRATSSQGSLV